MKYVLTVVVIVGVGFLLWTLYRTRERINETEYTR